MKIYTYEQVDKLLKDIAIAIERRDLSLMPKELQPIEITEAGIKEEALRRNKDDCPDELGYGTDAFENGAKWVLSKFKKD